MKYLPIFKKDDNLFFLFYGDYLFDNESDAEKTGLGIQMVEGVIFEFKFSHVLKNDGSRINCIFGKLGNLDIGVIEGSIWDDAQKIGQEDVSD